MDEEISNTNRSKINIENIKGNGSFLSIHKPVPNASKEVVDIKNHSLSEKQKKQKSRKSINLSKIKTLLPYVILKRAYSKLKQKQGKYNKKSHSEDRNDLNGKTRHQSSSHEKLIDSLCKQSAGTSICKLVSKIRTKLHPIRNVFQILQGFLVFHIYVIKRIALYITL